MVSHIGVFILELQPEHQGIVEEDSSWPEVKNVKMKIFFEISIGNT